MSKQVSFNKEAQDKLLTGLNIVAEAVGGTMGPKGRNVYFEADMGSEVTNDGATIASRIYLADKEEDAGAYIIRNATGQTNDDAGDGTTTTAVLTQAIVHECIQRPENPIEIRESLNSAGQKVLSTLATMAQSITKDEIKEVAMISAEDEEIASQITEIVQKLGEKAVINVEDSKSINTYYEIVDGYEAQAGFMSPYFINDHKQAKAIYSDVYVLVAEKKIQNLIDIKPLFDQLAKQSIGQLVIVCDDIDDSIVGVLVQNKSMGIFNSVVIRASGDTLKDIEGAVGAQRVSDSTGVTFKGLTIEHLGKADKVVADAHKTLFLGSGDSAKQYATFLEMGLQNETNQINKEIMEKRIAKLRDGVATLFISAPTDPERIYRRRKAEDAVKATLAALEEGVVEGGGMALYRLAKDLEDNSIGGQILRKAMTAPLRKIVENAGKDYTEIVSKLGQRNGYDAKNDEFTDMFVAGILDPAKVTRTALQNAISIAGTVITTFCLITEKPNESKST